MIDLTPTERERLIEIAGKELGRILAQSFYTSTYGPGSRSEFVTMIAKRAGDQLREKTDAR